MKLTWNGRGVPARIAAMVWVMAGGGSSPTPSEPSPPALLTATASSGVMPTNAIPAWATGVLNPYASVNLVFSSMPSTLAEARRAACRPTDRPGFTFMISGRHRVAMKAGRQLPWERSQGRGA